MSTSSNISPDVKELQIKFRFEQEIKDAENWLVRNGSTQIRRIDKNDINKIVCLSEFTLGLKISGLSDNNSINSYRGHILELIDCLETKKLVLTERNNMRVVAWAVLALESTFDLLNKLFDDKDKSRIIEIFIECVNNLRVMVNDVKSDEEFSVYDLASSLRALYKANRYKKDLPKYVIDEGIEKLINSRVDVLNHVIDEGIEKLINSRVEGKGYPFTNKNKVSRISSTAFVLCVLGEILKTHEIDYTNKNIKIREKDVEENINSSINYLFDNYPLWTREDFEATNYYPYPFVHFTLAYVTAALFIHGRKVGFRDELIDALSELYDHRKDGGFAIEKGAEPFWYSTFDAIYALRTVEDNICILGGLLNTIEKLEELVDLDKKCELLEKENTKLKRDIRIKNNELKKRDEKIKRLQEKLLKKEEMVSILGIRIPLLLVSSVITTVIAVVSVLTEFNLVTHATLWLVIAIVGIGLYLRLKSIVSMYIMCGVLTGVLIGGTISLYIAGELSLLSYLLLLIIAKIVALAFYDALKKGIRW